VPASALTLPPPPKSCGGGAACGGGAPKFGAVGGSGGGAPIGAPPIAPGGGIAPGVGGFISGIFAEPGIGGATPTIVPFNLLGGGPAGRGGIAAGPPGGAAAGGAPGGTTPGGAAPPTGPACWLDMSIVPLNFGAAAPFRLKLHFVHVWAVSGFCVPQFGQNTEPPLVVSWETAAEHTAQDRKSSRGTFALTDGHCRH